VRGHCWLAASPHAAGDIEALVRHVEDRLVNHFGVDVIECWLGKDGARKHAMREVAAAAVAHLAPLIDTVPAETMAELISTETIGASVPAPWDDHWRNQPRTAGWRT